MQDDDAIQALAQQFDLPWAPHLDAAQVSADLVNRVPITFARRFKVLPLREEDGAILIATTDPTQMEVLDDLRLLLGKPVKPVLTTPLTLLATLNQVYDRASASGAEAVMEDLVAEGGLDRLTHELEEPQDLLDATDEAPIIRLVNSILFEAVKRRASDIHVESFERGLVIR